VLLDNLEQLLPEAAGPLADLVAAAPTLRLITTSREPLRIAAETQLDVPPLVEDEAVELFLERARAVRPEIEVSDAVVELCERLDRLPLAIELAAARMRVLEPTQVLERLPGALDLLTGTRDADDRHATLRATIEWSYDLLANEERRLFASLAVFRSGWTLETAEAVCDADLDDIASLLDKSLVRRRIESNGAVRFWMLEMIRTFARERLQELPDLEDEVHRRHAEHVLAIARAAHLSSEDQGRGAPPEHERVLAERDEVRAALDWAEAHDRELAAEIVVALEEHWVTSAPSEGWGRVENLLAGQALSAALTARLLRLRGGLVLFLRGARGESETCYREALDLFRSLGDDDNVVALLARFAVLAGYWDDPDDVRRLVTEVRELNRTVENPIVEPQMLSTLSSIARREGDVEEALDLCRASVAAARACGFRMWMLWMLDGQLELELKLGLLDEAEATGRDGLDLATSLDDRRLIRSLLTGLALIALRRGDRERAGALWGVVAELEREDPLLAHDDLFSEFATPLRESEDKRFLAAVEAGRALSLPGAVGLALDAAQTLP
jgi:predicted ATPase